MTEIMAKNTGINSKSFYGNQNIKRKPKQNVLDDIPDKKKLLNGYNDEDIDENVRRPPKQSYFGLNSQKPLIEAQELLNISNGFESNKKGLSLSGKKSQMSGNKGFKQRDQSLKLVKSVKLNMKSAIESNENTPILHKTYNNLEKKVIKESQNHQKITNYFSRKSPQLNEINDTNEEQNENQMNGEVISTPIIENTNPENCETPKSWKHISESVNVYETDVNPSLFNTEFNDFEENNLNVNQIFVDWPEIVILEPNTPIGLKNLGNTCYMNSIVQSLFALKFFIEDLEMRFNEIKNFCEEINDFLMTLKLLNLYNQYNGLRTKVEKCSIEDLNSDLSELKLCVGQKSSPFLSGSQQDAAEFFYYVIDTIAEEFESFKPSEIKNNPIWRNFRFETGGTLICQKCHNKTQQPNERFNALYLSIPEDNSLQTAFDDFLKDEITGHECTLCGAKQNILTKYLAKRSKVLFLQLARYTQDGSKRTEQVLVPQVIYLTGQSECSEQTIAPSPLATPYRSKLQDVSISNRVATVVRKINFDNSLNDENNENLSNGFENLENDFGIKTNENHLSNNSTNGLEFENSKQIIEENPETNVSKSNNRVKYQLVAVVCHHGISLSVGHYTCYVYSIENNQWFECDDNRITKTNFDCVQKFSQTSGYCYFYVLS